MKRMYNIMVGVLFLCCMNACSAQTNLIADKLETNHSETLLYYLYFPQEYEKTDKEFPILLFLHGGGEAGAESLEALKSGGPPKLIAEGKQFPFLILAPQNPHKKKWWNTNAVKQLLDNIVDEYRVNKKRIYLTGLSRGGGAAWEMAAQYPDTFAAMAVVCGMTPKPYASWIHKALPIWVFHGEEDQSIPISESEEMVRILRKMGHQVKFTRYPKVGHNAWDKAYTTDALYDWFMEQGKN